MKVADIRRENVRTLIRERFKESIADFARAIDRDDAQVWQLLNDASAAGRNIGERLARHIERSLMLASGSLDLPGLGGRATELVASEPAVNHDVTRVPVVGTAQLGEDGFHVELDYPTGHGDGYIPYPTRDPNAYALRVKGDSMRPRIKHGEFVLVQPNTSPQPGDEVLLRITDGRVMVKVLDFRRDGVVQVSSVNENHKPMTFDTDQIERLHYVAAIVKPGMYYQSFA